MSALLRFSKLASGSRRFRREFNDFAVTADRIPTFPRCCSREIKSSADEPRLRDRDELTDTEAKLSSSPFDSLFPPWRRTIRTGNGASQF